MRSAAAHEACGTISCVGLHRVRMVAVTASTINAYDVKRAWGNLRAP
jgi:hypothetical protein